PVSLDSVQDCRQGVSATAPRMRAAAWRTSSSPIAGTCPGAGIEAGPAARLLFMSTPGIAAAARNGLDFPGGGTTFGAMELPHDRPPNDRPGPDRPLFEAELRPHRSLSPRGFMILMAVFG